MINSAPKTVLSSAPPISWWECYCERGGFEVLLAACRGFHFGATTSAALKTPHPLTSINVGASLACYRATAAYTAAVRIVCHGSLTKRPSTFCAFSRNGNVG